MLGDFSGGKPFEYDNGYDLTAMIEHVRSVVGIPVITGLQFGHIPSLVTLPVGADAHLVADAHGFKLTVSGYPYLGGVSVWKGREQAGRCPFFERRAADLHEVFGARARTYSPP